MPATAYLRTVRGLNRDTRLVIASWVFSSFGTMGIDAVLGNLYILRLGYSSEYLGLINAVILLAMGVSSLPSSELGRRWGYRRAQVLGLAMATVGLALVPATQLLPQVLRATWLAVTYTFAYVGIIVRAVNTAPYLMACTAADERSHAFALQNALAPAGAFLGSLAAGLLPPLFERLLHAPAGSPLPYALSILVAAVAVAPSVPTMLAATEHRGAAAHADERPAADARVPVGTIALVSGVLLLAALGDGPVSVFFNAYLDAGLHASVALIGTLMAIARLVTIPAALMAPLLMSRWGHGRTFALATLAGAIALVPLATVLRWQAAAFGFVSMLALVGLASPAMVVFHQSLMPPRWRATMSGAVIMVRTLGLAAMSLVAGGIIQRSGYPALFRISAAAMGLGACLFWLLFCRPKRGTAETQRAQRGEHTSEMRDSRGLKP